MIELALRLWIIPPMLYDDHNTPEPRKRKFATLPPYVEQPAIIRVYQMPRPGIQFITALTEAADGIGLIRTLDEQRGIIECWIMPDYLNDFDRMMTAIAAEYPLQQLGQEFE